MEENSDGLRNKLVRTDSKKSSDASESESESQYVDCEDVSDESDESDDVDGVFDDSNPGLEFEYEPGISLSSLHFYQTCECQNHESESGERGLLAEAVYFSVYFKYEQSNPNPSTRNCQALVPTPVP